MNLIKSLIYKFISVDNMLKPDVIKGEIPSTKEAYTSLGKIAFPSVAEQVLMSLIMAVDTLMVGKVSSEAIAAVGLTTQPRMIMLALFFAMNIGITAIIARRKGENRRMDANLSLKNALILVFIMSIVMALICNFVATPLINLAGAKSDTFVDARAYFVILLTALPLNALTMAICAAQRGIGNTKITLVINMIANVVNVIFNFLLIEGRFGFPRLEVRGAAIATVIGYSIGFILAVISVSKKGRFLYFNWSKNWRIDFESLRSILNVGSSAAVEQAVIRIGFFAFSRMIADLGTSAFAAHQICIQFLNITYTFGDGISVAATSLVSQNLGKKRQDISMLYGKIAIRMGLIVASLLFFIIIIFKVPMIKMFNSRPDIVGIGVSIMVVLSITQFFQITSTIYSACLRGAGDTKYVAMVMGFCIAVLRPILTYLAIYVFSLGVVGAWYATLFDISLRMILGRRRFLSNKWTEIVL